MTCAARTEAGPICEQCGQPIPRNGRSHARWMARRYCGNKCRSSVRTIRYCEACEKPIPRTSSSYVEWSTRRYCTKACMAAAQENRADTFAEYRQIEVTHLLNCGESYAEIAKALHMKPQGLLRWLQRNNARLAARYVDVMPEGEQR